MAMGDDMMECSFSSLILDIVGTKQSDDVLALRDLDWVLVTNEDLDSANSFPVNKEKSETNWNSCLVKDALLDSKILDYSEEMEDSRYIRRDVDVIQIDDATEEDIDDATEEDVDDYLIGEDTITFQSDAKLGNAFSVRCYIDDYLSGEDTVHFQSDATPGNAFFPSHQNKHRGFDDSDTDMDLGFPEFDDIFKLQDWPVWEIPGEEGKLIKQLNKVLSECSLQPTSVSLDDLRARIAYLSLNGSSG